MDENVTIDLKHYKSTCKGCQFTNLPEYNMKCPYFSHPKNTNLASKCFFREFVTLEQLMETRAFINSEKARIPAEIKKFLQMKEIIEQENFERVYGGVFNERSSS